MTKIGRKKSLSRLMAIQIFYQSKFIENSNLEKIKDELIENYLLESDEAPSSYEEKIDKELLDNLIIGLEKNSAEIDVKISEFLRKDSSMEDLDPVILQILRLAVFEIQFSPEIAANIITSEYVDIAASFFDDSQVTFVNAIIDGIAKLNR
jgi:transcription antitermination factor NusB